MLKTIGEWGQNPAEFLDWYSHALSGVVLLSAVARTRVLDHLGDEPRTVTELAADAGLDPGQLAQLLGFLASQGVLKADAAGRYAHGSFSRQLRSDHPASLVPQLHVSVSIFTTAAVLPEALKTGQVPHQVAHNKSYFDLLRDDPALAGAFVGYMTATTHAVEQFILTHHQFRPFKLAVDVGGSHGSLLLQILATQHDARGILFDLPEVISKARDVLAHNPNSARVEAIGGSFFDAVPAGGDLYLLKQILHDWDDAQCAAILRRVRAAIAPNGRLAVFDRLMPETHEPHPAYQMDLYMLLLQGGKERRLSEFEALFAASGFRLDRVTRDVNFPCVIEAVPV